MGCDDHTRSKRPGSVTSSTRLQLVSSARCRRVGRPGRSGRHHRHHPPGKPVARLTAVARPRKPIDAALLRSVTAAAMPLSRRTPPISCMRCGTATATDALSRHVADRRCPLQRSDDAARSHLAGGTGSNAAPDQRMNDHRDVVGRRDQVSDRTDRSRAARRGYSPCSTSSSARVSLSCTSRAGSSGRPRSSRISTGSGFAPAMRCISRSHRSMASRCIRLTSEWPMPDRRSACRCSCWRESNSV